jgi:hypothetical protein
MLILFCCTPYPRSFSETSTFTLPQAGVYKGPDGIAEYVRFLSAASPLIDESGTLEQRVELLRTNSGICTFRRITTTQIVASDGLYPGGVFNFATILIINFDYAANKIPSITLYLTPQSLAHFFETWAGSTNSSARDFVCSTMEESCPSVWASNGLTSQQNCLDTLDALPIVQDGAYIDGNSQSCRVLHAVFASTNDKHCAHISFVPETDHEGAIKCQESAGILPGDTFTADDFRAFGDWLAAEGLPPSGYVVDPVAPSNDVWPTWWRLVSMLFAAVAHFFRLFG